MCEAEATEKIGYVSLWCVVGINVAVVLDGSLFFSPAYVGADVEVLGFYAYANALTPQVVKKANH